MSSRIVEQHQTDIKLILALLASSFGLQCVTLQDTTDSFTAGNQTELSRAVTCTHQIWPCGMEKTNNSSAVIIRVNAKIGTYR